MPFGLCSALATFQRVMDKGLTGLKWQTCLVFLDDGVELSSSFDEHLRLLETVLQAIKTYELT